MRTTVNITTSVDIEVIMSDDETATIRGIVKRVVVTPDAYRKYAIGD